MRCCNYSRCMWWTLSNRCHTGIKSLLEQCHISVPCRRDRCSIARDCAASEPYDQGASLQRAFERIDVPSASPTQDRTWCPCIRSESRARDQAGESETGEEIERPRSGVYHPS